MTAPLTAEQLSAIEARLAAATIEQVHMAFGTRPGPAALETITKQSMHDARTLLADNKRMQKRAYAAEAKIDHVLRLLERHGCDCDCDHDANGHDDDCERCFACQINGAVWP